MKLRINAFMVTLATNKGPYRAKALFDGGLNVIRAENTSGKSALMNGMLYALGLEILVGKWGVEATKPVLWGTGDYDSRTFNVLESFVEIEIANASGEVVTVRRQVKGDMNKRLIEVVHGPIVTGRREKQHLVEHFFVSIEGAAQRERGFHHFLAEFLELELPIVKKFKGSDVPLYVECIAPLMFIEQIRGWSGIQATLRQSFGIRNVAKLAVEYILGLDVIENEKQRTQISEEANQIREDWRGVRELMSQIAFQAGGRLMNVLARPVIVLSDEPWIAISGDGEDVTLDDFLVAKRSLLIESSSEETAGALGNEELEIKLEAQEDALLVAQAGLSQLRSNIRAEEDELRKLQSRLDFIKTDIQRNKDVKRLHDFGAEAGLSLVQDRCPTCNQSIKDSLIPTESTVMGIEENIKFLKTELDAVKLLISSEEERLARLQGRKARESQIVTNLRATIRDLRSDLLGSRDFSVAAIREQVHLQEEITKLEHLRDDFEGQLGRLRDAAERWQENRARHSELPDDYFSEEDKGKLDALSECFAKNVQRFGYRSTGVAGLHISEGNYRPVCDEFEVAFGASASDNIRLIWAYTLALLQVSSSHGGKHWGVLLFDEPEQQKMKDASSDALYTEIAQMQREDSQVIIATSASRDVTSRRLDKLPHKLLEFGEKVIRPIQQ
ncbi:MAG: hypothetical protein DIAAKJNI_00057 [Candidatus Argoarchaeum ethanivorans]|uniref:Rad50/SbcC-type AAA domain-containing protein n=1 Tax=Candidatus Argoarchaeum ethanivorans TaxID=2608793 RepID=A0A811T1L4_9EURY|nr:MAG: hypothetical protein DIAAKJNI_00057 [Candidatus Argoarchaeum ethanivorans]